jgi:hypothetical protein
MYSSILQSISRTVSICALVIGTIGCMAYYVNPVVDLATLIYVAVILPIGIFSFIFLLLLLLQLLYTKTERKNVIRSIVIVAGCYALLLVFFQVMVEHGG